MLEQLVHMLLHHPVRPLVRYTAPLLRVLYLRHWGA